MIADSIFYLFAIALLVSALMVITAKNPVHAVLFLIFAFFNAAGLFVMLGAEFLGMILAIVYVGAVAVLFLFVVMMLDIDFAVMRKGAYQYLPLGLVLGTILLLQFTLLLSGWDTEVLVPGSLEHGAETNAHAIGLILYTDYIVPFQISGVILLVAMIGAIVLTHRRRLGVRRQNIKAQTMRDRNDVVTNEKPKSGEGVKL